MHLNLAPAGPDGRHRAAWVGMGRLAERVPAVPLLDATTRDEHKKREAFSLPFWSCGF